MLDNFVWQTKWHINCDRYNALHYVMLSFSNVSWHIAIQVSIGARDVLG